MARTRKTKYIILGFLYEEGKSGYDIKKCVEMDMAYYWQESFGQIYPTLKKMEEEGLVERVSKEVDGRIKHEYFITQKGKEIFIEYMQTPVEPEIHKYEILVKLRFGSSVSLEISKKNVEKFRERHIMQLDELNSINETHFKGIKLDNELIFHKMTLMLGMETHEAQIRWADNVLSMLNEKISLTQKS